MLYRRAALLCWCACAIGALAQQPEPILDYIKRTWPVLTRSHRALAAAAADPKFHPAANGKWPVYISSHENRGGIVAQLGREMPPADFASIEIKQLPSNGELPREHGLLYLPRPYVVPGGRFNEMYGWDSYFIERGLLRDGLVGLSKDMADNFLYEIRNYAKILNANRTYYLTRSQPPFLTEMVWEVYQRTHDRKWLESAVPAIEEYYRCWTNGPHLTPSTGLSRYIDSGEGPAPEVLASERNAQGRTHYDQVLEFFRAHADAARESADYYDSRQRQLTPLFYKGDRSMRESGFDPSDRFGPFSVDIIHYNPVCLNSLLYLMEAQTAEILSVLGREQDAAMWRTRAAERAERINRLMWDEADGLYEDYDFVRQRKRHYPFLTTFYPLWAGIATKRQAAGVVGKLALFEQSGGLETSTTRSGNQWDAPFGWAPLELIAIEGLRRYGYSANADRLSVKFLTLVEDEYRRTGTIVEKYDVARRSADVKQEIGFGYNTNEAGFGWTNATFTCLLDALPKEQRSRFLSRR